MPTQCQLRMRAVQLFALALCMLHVAGKRKLVIGGIFPMKADQGGWPGGQGCRPSAILALRDVNAASDILPDYELVMIDDDSQCQPGLGAKVMYELLYKGDGSVKIMLLTGCSLVTTLVAEAASLWNLIVVSYGASSPALSDRERFPTLFRTHPSATIHNPTRVAVFKKFKWKRISILQSVEEVFTSTADNLEDLCQSEDIKVLSRQSFFGDPTDAVANLKRQDARIVVGVFYEKEARRVFCQVYREGLYGQRYVWFLIGWYSNTWFVPRPEEGLNCTAEQMLKAAQFHFTTEALMWADKDQVGVSGMTTKQFKDRLDDELMKIGLIPNETGGYVESPLAYDAVWALALALNCSDTQLQKRGLSLEDFNYENSNSIYTQIHKCMRDTKFSGASGSVMFSDQGDRITLTKVEQLQGGSYKKIGEFDYRTKHLNWEAFGGAMVQWPRGREGLMRPPQDETKVKIRLVRVSDAVFYGLSCLAVVVIAFAAICFAFNFVFRARRHVIESQPLCNHILLAGCAVCCIAVFLLGLDGGVVREENFPILCQARVWLVMYGFSLSFGSMFSKVFRAHRMSAKEVKDTSVPAWKLWSLVAVLCLVDTVILITWAVVDPLQRTVERLEKEKPSDEDLAEDVVIQPVLEHCSCAQRSVWVGIVFSYKGLQLLFGVFLAYDIRSVKLKYINDSRFVGMAIYNVVILTLITGPVSLIISSQPDASFAFISITLLLCTAISMALVFGPKMLYIYRVPSSSDRCSMLGDAASQPATKDEEERYKKLVAENEEIKKKIAEKEVRICELRRRLEARLAMSTAQVVPQETQHIVISHHKAPSRNVSFCDEQARPVDDSGFLGSGREEKSAHIEECDGDVIL